MWSTVQHWEVGLESCLWFEAELCIVYQSQMKADDFQFDSERCSTLSFDTTRDSQFELGLCRVWCLKVAELDFGFQSEWAWCSSAPLFQDHLWFYSVAFSSLLPRGCCFPASWVHRRLTQENCDTADCC